MQQDSFTRERELFQILEEAAQCEGDACLKYEEALQHTNDPGVIHFLTELATREEGAKARLLEKLNELKAVAELQDEINDLYG